MVCFATLDDCEALSTLATKVWLKTYGLDGITDAHIKYVNSNLSSASFRTLIQSSSHRIVTAKMKSTVVGLALVNLDSKCKIRPSGFEIERLYVHSSFQNNGIGRAMLSFISDNIGKAFWLYTWTENASNNFYEHVGFRKIGTQDIRFSQQVILNNVYAFVAR